MHVCYIHQHFCTPSGPFGTRSYEFSKYLLKQGHRVSMVCGTTATKESYAGVRRYEEDGIQIHQIGASYQNSMGFVRRLLAYGDFARRATRVASDIDSDVVYASSTPLSVGIPGMKASSRRGVPFIFEVRDLWPELLIALGVLRNPFLKWYARRLEKKIYSAAKHIVALAPGMRDGICKVGYPEESVTVIPNACDTTLFSPTESRDLDDRFGSPDDVKFVFAGAHGTANGLDAVLDAALELKRMGESTGIRFVFVGDGGLKDGLIQRSKQEGTDHFISWLPLMPKADLAKILPRMDVGMMILRNIPSFYYGTSPNKFFDYIASGLPVLTNYPGWVADMIQQSECGKVVPPDNPAAFANGMISLRDSTARKQMGEQARQLAVAKFERLDLAKQFLRVIETNVS